MDEKSFEVIIVGAGPAGLSAALILGRARRKVLVIDNELPRNRISAALHGFITRDGIGPAELLCLAREEIRAYPSVSLRNGTAVDAKLGTIGFCILLDDNDVVVGRKLLLATGIGDVLPALTNIERFYGNGVYHCPYCDGWEVRDTPLAMYGKGHDAVTSAIGLTVWSNTVALLTDGDARIDSHDRDWLRINGILLFEDLIQELQGSKALEQVLFTNGTTVAVHALFFSTPEYQRSALAERLGCKFNGDGGIDTNDWEATCVPGLFAAGNALKEVQLAIVAAAQGATAAFGINRSLLKDYQHSIRHPLPAPEQCKSSIG